MCVCVRACAQLEVSVCVMQTDRKPDSSFGPKLEAPSKLVRLVAHSLIRFVVPARSQAPGGGEQKEEEEEKVEEEEKERHVKKEKEKLLPVNDHRV